MMSSDPSPEPSRTRRRARSAVIACLLVLGVATVSLRDWLARVSTDDSERTDFLTRYRGGALVIAGGGNLPTVVRERFLDLAGGPNARLVVIPAYDATAEQQRQLQRNWQDAGVTSVQVLHATTREQAEAPEFARVLDQATGVWLTGGDQAWLSQLYAGTPVEAGLQAVIARQGVGGGSSAGAAAMTRIMIENGASSAVVGTGLDLLPDAVIDQHFLRRSRLNRLFGLMQSHPDIVAFGIDEGTALVVQVRSGRLGVLGSSYVLAYVPQTDQGHPRFEVLKHRDQIDMTGLKNGLGRVESPADLDAALKVETSGL